jgi:hypothetical protein
VLRYTPRASARLRISTDNDGTGASFDTVVWAQPTCASLTSTSAALGCNDDVGSGTRRLASTFTTTAAVTAGTPVYIVVAGYGSTSTGAFELTVTEVVPLMAGAACDPRTSATQLCATGLTCIATAGSTTMGTCVADGAAGGRCRAMGMACDAMLACSGSASSAASRCRAAVPVGGACDPTGAASVCPTGSACLSMGAATVCLADGSVGGRCRMTGTACDAGAGCSAAPGSAAARCQATVAVGAACDPARVANVCATASHCALVMDRWTCVADGARGGYCRTAPACDASLTCVTGYDFDLCRATVPAGGACDASEATTVCASGTSCVAAAGEATGVCTAAGTVAGAECRSSRRCDSGLTCSAIGQVGWCRTAAAVGAACDRTGRYNTCASGSSCAPTMGAAGACVARIEETEPNDTPATASPTITESTVFHGAVEAGGRDCVAVTVPMGASLFVEVQLPGTATCPFTGPDPYVEVYNPAGALIAVEDDSPGRGRCSLLDPLFHPEVRDLPAGRYAVCLREYGTPALSNYQLTVGLVR